MELDRIIHIDGEGYDGTVTPSSNGHYTLRILTYDGREYNGIVASRGSVDLIDAVLRDRTLIVERIDSETIGRSVDKLASSGHANQFLVPSDN